MENSKSLSPQSQTLFDAQWNESIREKKVTSSQELIQCPRSLLPLFDRMIHRNDLFPIRVFQSSHSDMKQIAEQLTLESHLSFVSIVTETMDSKWQKTMETLRDVATFGAKPKTTWNDLHRLHIKMSTLAYYRGVLYGKLQCLQNLQTQQPK